MEQAVISLDAMIDRVADGAFLRDLAKETGIDKRRLSERLRKHPDYAAAKEACIEGQLDDAQKALIDATTQADIARAREMFRAAAWRGERECHERWGQKTEISGNLNFRVVIAKPGEVIDGEAERVAQTTTTQRNMTEIPFVSEAE